MKTSLNNKQNKIIQNISYWYFIFCSIACAFVTLLPFWPTYEILILPKYILLFGPRWWLIACVFLLFVFWHYLSKRQLQFSVLFIVLSLNYLDFQLPTLGSFFSSNTNNDISILTANIGEGGSDKAFDYTGFTQTTDIILLQEARKINVTTIFKGYEFKECLSGLCIISKFPFKRVKTFDRKLFQGWGIFAVFYQVETPFGSISLANVHFETPRSVLMGLIYRTFDLQEATEIESNRQFEAELMSLWSKNKQHTLIVGDFNMPENENIYQNNFSHLHNAISVKGVGFNPTKITSWYGARIDHILYSEDFTVKDVEVIDSLKGDHRPVFATFTMSH
ncbi:MAG: endonuclease/exonuclease/phosphatase family protein [Colwellia sp.]|nr:endonuclease/exonuclease/phosphatase family protein [Colwellia sp.]